MTKKQVHEVRKQWDPTTTSVGVEKSKQFLKSEYDRAKEKVQQLINNRLCPLLSEICRVTGMLDEEGREMEQLLAILWAVTVCMSEHQFSAIRDMPTPIPTSLKEEPEEAILICVAVVIQCGISDNLFRLVRKRIERYRKRTLSWDESVQMLRVLWVIQIIVLRTFIFIDFCKLFYDQTDLKQAQEMGDHLWSLFEAYDEAIQRKVLQSIDDDIKKGTQELEQAKRLAPLRRSVALLQNYKSGLAVNPSWEQNVVKTLLSQRRSVRNLVHATESTSRNRNLIFTLFDFMIFASNSES